MINKVDDLSRCQNELPFVSLFPQRLPNGWSIKNISIRPENLKWSTLWYQVETPSATFRVKQFFQDIMEPTFPDTCILAAQGNCFQTDQLTYWRGTNYKGCDSYVLSLWKTQVEISIDRGLIEQEHMEHFLETLKPTDPTRAEQILRTPFHQLSFHARTGRGSGEISSCSKWMAPQETDVPPLPINLPSHWVLESIGIGNNETQFVYWDPYYKAYSLWANHHHNHLYHPISSWTRNYSPQKRIGKYEVYEHQARGTVIYQEDNPTGTQTAYIFRGAPTTNPEQVKSYFDLK